MNARHVLTLEKLVEGQRAPGVGGRRAIDASSVRIVQLLVGAGARIRRHQPLLVFEHAVDSTDQTNDHLAHDAAKRLVRCEFVSPWDGALDKWLLRPGERISPPTRPIAEIVEACSHPINFGGLCGVCGKDLTIADFTGKSDDQHTSIMMAHEHAHLRVSRDEAMRLEQETVKRLLKHQKLSLILDLDQTVIHATVDLQVASFLNAEGKQQYPALKDVYAFELQDQRNTYYVKLRPGLREFLAEIVDLYELHIYTMGTRNYAAEVSKIIDPDGKIFQERILSRDESGSMTQKTIKRLFPCEDSMVVALDDRADVWQWSPNLIKVHPYQYFIGTGDINAPPIPSASITEKKSQETKPTPESLPFIHPETDSELPVLTNVLKQLHERFYKKEGNRDVKKLLPMMKQEVLQNTFIVFSGLVPTGNDPEKSPVWLDATMFGATCQVDINELTTHVVAARWGSQKVHKACHLNEKAKRRNRGKVIHVVKTEWLYDSILKWSRQPESAYDTRPMSEPSSSSSSTNHKSFDLRGDASSVADESDADDFDNLGEGSEFIEASELWDMAKEIDDELGSDFESDSESQTMRSAQRSSSLPPPSSSQTLHAPRAVGGRRGNDERIKNSRYQPIYSSPLRPSSPFSDSESELAKKKRKRSSDSYKNGSGSEWDDEELDDLEKMLQEDAF